MLNLTQFNSSHILSVPIWLCVLVLTLIDWSWQGWELLCLYVPIQREEVVLILVAPTESSDVITTKYLCLFTWEKVCPPMFSHEEKVTYTGLNQGKNDLVVLQLLWYIYCSNTMQRREYSPKVSLSQYMQPITKRLLLLHSLLALSWLIIAFLFGSCLITTCGTHNLLQQRKQ